MAPGTNHAEEYYARACEQSKFRPFSHSECCEVIRQLASFPITHNTTPRFRDARTGKPVYIGISDVHINTELRIGKTTSAGGTRKRKEKKKKDGRHSFIKDDRNQNKYRARHAR